MVEEKVVHTSLVGLIRDEFHKGNEITLTDLYNILSKNPDVTIEHYKLGHRIRSAIYSLQKGNEIIRVRDATYKKLDKKRNFPKIYKIDQGN